MLVLTRRKGQSVIVGHARITLKNIEWNRSRLCINGSEIIIRRLKSVVIKGGIRIQLCKVKKPEIKLCIHAPESMNIIREEVLGKGKENVL